MSDKTQTHINYFQNSDKSLKDGKINCVIKIRKNFFPQPISNTTPFLCEFTNDEITLNSSIPHPVLGTQTTKIIKIISYTDISNINLSIVKRLNSILGIVPTYFLSLQLDILLKNNDTSLLECNSLEEIPKLLEIFSINNVNVIDKFNLNSIYKDMPIQDASNYLHNNYDTIANSIS